MNEYNNGNGYNQPPKKDHTARNILIAVFGIVIFIFLGLGSCSVGTMAIEDTPYNYYYNY